MPANTDTAALGAAIATILQAESAGRGYHWLPSLTRIPAGTKALEPLIVRTVLMALLDGFEISRSPIALPESVVRLYPRELERIRALATRADSQDIRFSLDSRVKDIAILTFRLIPVGAEFAEPYGRLWVRRIFTRGLAQFFRASAFFVMKRRGFRPYFQLHMHQDSHDDFHEAGWMETYRRLADLLECNPDHLGWYSSSWFVDPALAEISPHLAYLRRIPSENGGALFYMGREGGEASGALSTSRTRRRLYAEGRYYPRTYMRIWPREAVIAWRDQYDKRDP